MSEIIEQSSPKEIAENYLQQGKKRKSDGGVDYPLFVIEDLTNLLNVIVEQSEKLEQMDEFVRGISDVVGLHARKTVSGLPLNEH